LGYIFVVSVFGGLVSTLICVEIFYSTSTNNWFSRDSTLVAGYLLFCYLVFYLGLNRLMLLGLPKSIAARMLGSVALLAVTLLLTHLLPLLVVFYLNDYREFDYGWHQAFNIVWSVDEAVNNGAINPATLAFSTQIGASMVIVTLCAIGVFGSNLVMCTRDVLLVRVAAPPRVREEQVSSKAGKSGKAESEPHPVDPFAQEGDD
jgi:hypothetical protein